MDRLLVVAGIFLWLGRVDDIGVGSGLACEPAAVGIGAVLHMGFGGGGGLRRGRVVGFALPAGALVAAADIDNLAGVGVFATGVR